jgi:hypothetical protein
MKLSNDLTCAELVELVTEYFEGGLATDARDRFEEHISFCEGCEIYVDQMRKTIEATGRLREADIPPELEGRLLEAFRGWKSG